MKKTAAIIGGGVIGGGWLARFLLNGWDVNVFDLDPQAERKINEVLSNARRSLPGLVDVALPAEGKLNFCSSITKAVKNADWIQESVPERLDIKHKIYPEIQTAAREDAVIGSSTSGFKPSELIEGAQRPEQILVTHPFNPVYLVPLIEVVPHKQSNPAIVQKAMDLLTEIGMKPLHIRKEIDAHIADRLLEAVWRESLWLVNDDIASTQEIDDAIRFGFGIRWAQMGLFETYRVAGGEAGMAHFMAQFGPALKWPWTKLMDVPELTDELVQKVANQSDEQSGQYSIRELERIRDNNLVAMMRALKGQNWGIGETLRNHDAIIAEGPAEMDFSQPVKTVARAVPIDWTDYNGHMNETRYLEIFSQGTDRFMAIIGCDADYIAHGGSYFTAETHIRHLGEANAGERVYVTTQCLLGEGKKLHLFHCLYHENGRLLATGEHMLIHVSLKTRRAAPPAPVIADKLAEIAALHSKLTIPESAGRAIGQGR